MNIVLQTLNEIIEFLPSYEVENYDSFKAKVDALGFLRYVVNQTRDPSVLRAILAKEGNGINVSQLDDNQMLEALADQLFSARIKIRRIPKSRPPSAIGIEPEPQQYLTPREVEQSEKVRRGKRGLTPPLTVSSIKMNADKRDKNRGDDSSNVPNHDIFLNNTTNPEIRQALLERSVELRSQLPSKLKRSGNFGLAKIEIDGLPTELKAHSGINYPEEKAAEGFVLLPSKPRDKFIFTPRDVVAKGGGIRDAVFDTEFKILEDIATRLGSNTNANGRIDLFTERLACESCGDIILDFRNRFPNIQLNVFTRD